MACAHRSARISASPAGGPVALGEDQVHHPQHGVQPLRQVGRAGRPQRDARLPDLPLGPDQPLGHGRFRHQERGRDLGRAQPAHRAQRQRHPDRRVQGRMAAGEDQAELVVGQRQLRPAREPPGPGAGRRRAPGLGFPPGPALVPPDPVHGLVPGHADQPGPRAGRDPGGRPLRQRRRARVLHGVLTRLQVAQEAGEGGHRGPPVRAGTVRRSRSVRGLDRDHRPHLDRPVLGGRAPGRPLQGLVQVRALDQRKAAELLLDLGRGAVGQQRLAVALTRTVVDAAGGCSGAQSISTPASAMACVGRGPPLQQPPRLLVPGAGSSGPYSRNMYSWWSPSDVGQCGRWPLTHSRRSDPDIDTLFNFPARVRGARGAIGPGP